MNNDKRQSSLSWPGSRPRGTALARQHSAASVASCRALAGTNAATWLTLWCRERSTWGKC